MRNTKHTMIRRIIAAVLCAVILLGNMPSFALLAKADVSTSSGNVVNKLVDPATVNNWEKFLSLTNTGNAGSIWTDKSVFDTVKAYLDATKEAEDAAAQAGLTLLDPQNFLVALSAIASTKVVEGYSNIPTDTVLILDVSGSMQGSDDEMVNAANAAIHTLLSLNLHNRIGVALYSENSMTLLPIDRYSTTDTYEDVRYVANPNWYPGSGQNRYQTVSTTYYAYLELDGGAVKTGSVLKNSNGNTVRQNSKRVTGGTYIQSGLNQAMDMFLASDTKITGNVVQSGTVRMPVTVLMTDGDPTYGTTNYTDVGSREFGDGGNTSDELGFVTQLSAAYLKAKVEAHYQEKSLFYTLGMGVGDESVAESVLDPKNSNKGIQDYWKEFLADGSADWTIGGRNQSVRTVARPANDTIPLSAYANYAQYATQYFPADSANELNAAFSAIVDAITLQSMYYPTHVDGTDYNHAGYIEFRDYIGIGMEVQTFKGIQHGGVLFTGQNFAYNMKNNLGSVDVPTDIGNELVWAVMKRLSIDDVLTARTLIASAFAAGQLAYDDSDPNNITFSNYIGVFLDGQGKYVGFWDGTQGAIDRLLTDGDSKNDTATQAVKCYYMMGETGDGHRETDMLYTVIQIRTNIATGEQIVYGRVPAALIPLIQYQITLDSNDPMTATDISLETIANSPLRILYEVCLSSHVDVNDLANTAKENKVENTFGTYEFFTNQFEGEIEDGDDPSTAHNTFVSFQPSAENERYVYHEDMLVYVKNGNSYSPYSGSAAPSGAGYYRAYVVYTDADGDGKATAQVTYEAIPTQALTAATTEKSGSSNWIVKKGTIYRYTVREEVAKTENTTGTLGHCEHPIVHLSPAYHLDGILGNNGKLTIVVTPPKTVQNDSGEEIDGNAVKPGDVLTYSISATNYESTDTTITITDSIPAGTTYVAGSATADGVYSNSGLKWVITNVKPGTTVTVSFKVAVTGTPGSQIGNTATIQIGSNSPYVTNTTKNPIMGKTAQTTNVTGAVQTGDEITYTVHYYNDADTAAAVTITDIIPAGTTYIAGSATYSGTNTLKETVAGGVTTGLTWTIGSVPAGADGTVSFRVVVTAQANGQIENEASIQIGTNNPVVTNKTSNSRSFGNLILTKKVQAGNASGDTDKYFTLVLESDGLNGTFAVTGSSKVQEVTFSGGVAKLEIKHDEKITVTSLPAGISVDVYEEVPDGYTASYSKDVVTIVADASAGAEIDVTNTYNTTETFLTMMAEKTLIGRTLTEGHYRFQVIDRTPGSVTNGVAVSTGSNSAPNAGYNTGTVNFTRIRLAKAGTYTYEVSEIKGTDSLVKYDETKHTVIVTVSDNGDGILYVSEVRVDGQEKPVVNNQVDTDINFMNTYTPDDLLLHLQGKKILDNRSLNVNRVLKDKEFTFVIFEDKDGDGKYSGATVDQVVSSGTNDASGAIHFNVIEYNFEDMAGAAVNNSQVFSKEFTYLVAEVLPDVALDDYMFYSEAVHEITVRVDYDAKNALWSYEVCNASGAVIQDDRSATAAPDLNTEELSFTNIQYPNVIELPLYASKTTENGAHLNNAYFSISVYDSANREVAVGSVPATIQKSFVTRLSFTKAGTYTYTVKETKAGTSDNGITYDTASYVLTVKVSLQKGKLSIDEVLVDGVPQDPDSYSFAFRNKYEADGYLTLHANKTLNRAMTAGEFKFEIYTKVNGEKANVVAAGSNDINGHISFGSIYYALNKNVTVDANGEAFFTYYMSELKGTLPGVTYDPSEYEIQVALKAEGSDLKVTKVTVTKVGDPNATATVSTPNSGIAEVDTRVIFTNTYAPVVGDSITIHGNKILTGRDAREGEFAFRMYHVDAQGNILKLVESATNLDLDNGSAFDDFTFTRIYPATTAEGTYYYKIVEVAGNTPGVTYAENTVHTFQVTISHNTDGVLTAVIHDASAGSVSAAGGELSSLTFENAYKPTGTIFVPSVDKKLDGRDMATGEFRFEILDENGNVVSNGASVNSADGVASEILFGELSFTAAGEYHYEIKEIVGSLGGVRYDDDPIYMVVTVLDNTTTGKLEASAVYYAKRDAQTGAYSEPLADPVFENTYTAKPVDITISGHKTLTGKNLAVNEFTFILNQNGVEIPVGNRADGSFDFEMQYTSVGVYTYSVYEKKAVNVNSTGTYTYDDKVYTITVDVKDDGNGQLYASVIYLLGQEEVGAAIFHNTYTPKPVTLDLNDKLRFSKTVLDLAGTNFSPAGFRFKVYDWSGAVVAEAVSDADGKLDFEGDLVFTVAGDYRFQIVEEESNISGMIHDPNTWAVHVQILYDPVSGTLSVGKVDAHILSVSAQDHDDSSIPTTTDIDFVNTYDPKDAAVEILLEKELTGRTLKAGEFLFELLDEDGKIVATAYNDVNGSILFRFSVDKVGAYTYTARERNLALGGIVYDTAKIQVTVNVTDVGGELKAAVTYPSNITFRNTYDPKVINVHLHALKFLNGRELQLGEFEFVLKDAQGNEIDLQKNGAYNQITFHALPIRKAGTYIYTITEKNNGLGGVTYSNIVYTATITVTDDGLGTLSADVSYTYTDANGVVQSIEQPTFINGYVADPVNVDVRVSKSLAGRDMLAGEFEFVLTDKDQNTHKATNQADGTVAFDTLKFTQAGTYAYTLTETKGTKGGVTYDDAKYAVVITVTDNGEGKLEAVVTVDDKVITPDAEGICDLATFRNTYHAEPVKVDYLEAFKKLTGRKLKAEEFTFTLTDADGKVVASGKNDADGKVVLSEIEYTSAGVYTYTLAEVKGDLGGVTYDKKTYAVTLIVLDNGEGKLYVDSVSVGDVQLKDTNMLGTFENQYQSASVSVQLQAGKKLHGRDLLAGEFTFQIKDADGKVLTADNAADGTVNFAKIEFTKTGVYSFVLSEQVGSDATIVYDNTQHAVIVTVEDDQEGALYVKSLTVDGKAVALDVGIADTGTVFENTYIPVESTEPTEPEDPNPDTGDHRMDTFRIALMVLCGTAAAIAFVFDRKKRYA